MCIDELWVTCGCVFPARYMVSGLKSEHVFKMEARVSSTSSEEMASSSEDSASKDPINIAKGRGADLKEPTDKAEISRTRKVQRNQAGGKKTVRGQKDPKVSAYQRVRENRNEFLSVTSKNMLRCDACKETINKKKSTVRKHINSVKHNDAKRAIQKSKKRDQSLFTFLRRKDEEDNPKGETLPEDMLLAIGIRLSRETMEFAPVDVSPW